MPALRHLNLLLSSADGWRSAGMKGGPALPADFSLWWTSLQLALRFHPRSFGASPHWQAKSITLMDIYSGYPVLLAQSLEQPIVFPACVFDTFAKKQVVTSVLVYFWVFYSIMFVCVAVSIINLTGPKVTWKIGLWPCPWGSILIVLIKVGGDAHWGGALISLAGALEHRNGEQKLSSSMYLSHSVCWQWVQCDQCSSELQ